MIPTITAGELFDILKDVPRDMIIATHALGHTAVPWEWGNKVRVGYMKEGNKMLLVIGDFSYRQLNGSTDFHYVVSRLDGDKQLPEKYERRS